MADQQACDSHPIISNRLCKQPASTSSSVNDSSSSVAGDPRSTTARLCAADPIVLETTVSALQDLNAAGVACMLEGREDEALCFFERGLTLCGVHIQHLLLQNPGFLTRLSSKVKTQGGIPGEEKSSCLILPSCCDLTLQSIDPCKRNRRLRRLNNGHQEHLSLHRIQQAAFTFYERPFVFGNTFGNGSRAQLKAAYDHSSPVLLYNLALLVHRRAVTSTDCFLAYELYRLSLFLMEENTIQGWYDQGFDVLLLALFNNLGELNGSFFQYDQFALCRDKLLLVFLNADLAQIRGDDYAFFYEQLVFSVYGHNSAAPAA